MRVVTVGDDESGEQPEVAAVGAIHGDEPCGVRAIERFLEEGPVDRVRRPARLVVANEEALAAGKRYVDVDLNRVFPGNPSAPEHERRLAADLLAAVDGCLALGFHSTVSFDEPFGTLADPTPEKTAVMRALPLAHAADFTGVVEGRSVNLPRFVNVEAGYQGSQAAADNAYDCLLAFLRHTGVLPGDPEPTPTTHYRVRDAIEKAPDRSYTVRAANFQRVAAGEPFAETDDGTVLRADRPFWPVLMSADGHSRLLGYRSEDAGPMGE
jgi:predicted deacylase